MTPPFHDPSPPCPTSHILCPTSPHALHPMPPPCTSLPPILHLCSPHPDPIASHPASHREHQFSCPPVPGGTRSGVGVGVGTWWGSGSREPHAGVSGGPVSASPAWRYSKGVADSKQQDEAVQVPMVTVPLWGGPKGLTAPRSGGDIQDPEMELGRWCSSRGVPVIGM